MKPSPILVLLGTLVSACAHRQAEPHAAPVTTQSAQAVRDTVGAVPHPTVPPVVATNGGGASRVVPSKDSTAGNAALSYDRKVARDSVADAAALAGLNNTNALNSLPPVPIDDETKFDLNAEGFSEQPRVQYFLDYFSTRGRERFEIWLSRIPTFESLIHGTLNDNKLPADLMYLALIESGFSPTAVSSASAVGMWQFMSATGKGYGLRVDGWVDERRDPVKSTNAAARHLRDLTDRFGSYYLAAAAYNAGAGKVGRGLTRMNGQSAPDAVDDSVDLASGDDFFSLANTRLLKQETKDYIPKLIAATLIAKNPDRYGFNPAIPTTPFSLDSVLVMGGTGLDLIARLADTTLDAMRALNPHLLRLVAPPTLSSYYIRVPAGSAAAVAERYGAVLPEDRLALSVYKLKASATVATIAKETNARAEDIMTVNRAARAGGKIPTGTTLYIPHTTIPISLLRDAGSSTTTMTHLVKSGETLGGIAQRYHVTAASIRSANHLGSKSVIRVGQRLNIAGRSDVSLATSSVSKAKNTSSSALRSPSGAVSSIDAKPVRMPITSSRSYVVKSGDTVSGIARAFSVNQAQLISLNRLGVSKKITVGQRLKIPG